MEPAATPTDAAMAGPEQQSEFVTGCTVWVVEANGYTKAEVLSVNLAKQVAEVEILCEVRKDKI